MLNDKDVETNKENQSRRECTVEYCT
jgi:hypothetical protein